MTPSAQVALDLRWRLVREVLLDPFAWVGGVVIALVLARLGGSLEGPAAAAAAPLAAGLLGLTIGSLGSDVLLFETKENELLRTQPLGPRGLLAVRRAELGWWLHPIALLAAAFGAGAGGASSAIAAWIAVRLGRDASLVAALRLRTPGRGRRVLAFAALGVATSLGALAIVPGLDPGAPVWGLPLAGAAPVALGGLVAGRALTGVWDRRYEAMASAALAAPSLPHSRLWPRLARAVPLPPALRARWTRDLLLFVRGQDGRGAVLLLLAPLSVLAIDLDPTPTGGQLLWRALSAAALGGGAIAYAVGPGVHRLRIATLPWARTAPRPGRRALLGAMFWGLGLATLHGLWVLTWIGAARSGWFLADLPALVGPVLGLELAMAHFAVAFTLSRATGQRVLGEGMLIFAIPVVAIGVALAGVLAPWLIPLYFVATVGLMADAARRIDAIEVTW